MAILQFRRGGSLVGSLLASEMFFDETINTFKIGTDGSGAYVIVTKLNESNVGSLSLTGNISASNAYFTGNVDLDGDIFIGGNITLGVGGNDTIFVGAPLSGSLIPLSGSQYDLGSSTKPWSTIHTDTIIATTISGSVTVSYPDIINKPTLVSGSSQIDHNTTSNYVLNEHINHLNVSMSAGNGLSGGGNITTSRILTLDTGSTHFTSGIKTSLNAETVISGSSQVSYVNVSNIPAGIISSSNQLTNVFLEIGGDNVVSGSNQVSYPLLSNIPAGIVSGSSQIDHNLTTNYNPLEHFTSASLLLPSSQISDFSSSLSGKTNTSIYTPTGEYNVATKKYVDDAIVGAGGYNDEQAQDAVGNILTDTSTISFRYDDVTTLISASVILSAISIPSSQITDFNTSVKTRLDVETVISGSSQLTSSYDARYELSGSAVALPSGLVSGSSQLTGSYDIRYALSSSGITLPADSPGSFQIGISGSILTVTGNVELIAAEATGFEQTLPPQSGILTLGTGSIGTIPKFTTQYEIADSVIVDNTTYVSLTGGAYFSGSFYGDGSNLSGVTSYTNADTLNYINSINVISGSSQVSYPLLSNIPANIVSGSSQVSYVGLSNIPAGIVSGAAQIPSILPTDIVSGSSQVIYTQLSSIPSGIVSGSSQVVSILSSLNTYTGSNDTLNTAQNSRLTSIETLTGSFATTYEQKASGTHTLFSGSSQVNADTIANFDANVLTYINSQAVLSGSGYLKNTTDTLTGDLTITGIITAQEFHTEFISSSIIYQSGSTKFGDTGDDAHQFTGSVSISGSLSTTSTALVTNLNADLLDSQHGTYYLDYTNFTNLPTLISGSSQVSYTQLSSIPAGIVSGAIQITPLLPTGTISGSSQVSYLGLSNIPSGIISSSVQVTGFEEVASGTHTLISGSSQVVYTQLSSIPSGIVSSSAQISKSLQDVTTVGGTTTDQIIITNNTASTTHTTGALFVSGGIGTSGNINAGGEITAYAASDIRLKNNITPITNPIQKVQQLSGNTFDWNEELQDLHKGSDVGVIAQEVELLFPSLVSDRTNGYKGVRYEKLVPLLIEAIKELSNKVEILEKKLENK